MAAAAKLLFEASFVPLSFNGGGGHREDAVRQNDGNLAAGRAGCCHQRWHHLKPKLIVSEPSNSGGIDRRVWGVPGGHTHARHRQRHRSVVEASQVAYTSSDDEQPTSSSLVETSGQVVFQRHRSKTKFQYASSLERLGLARLSSTESREAALAMGIEEIGEQGTPVCIGFTVMKEGRGDLRLEGAVDTALVVPCARCACSVGVPIEGAFNLLLTAKPLRVVGRTVVGIVRGRKDQELEDLEEAEAMAGALDDEAYDLDLDDKKYFPPEAAEIDLSEYIRETILLKVPIRVLCKEDCKGLCIDCGADWNKQTCTCAQNKKLSDRGAPRTNWGSDLAQLRDRLRKES